MVFNKMPTIAIVGLGYVGLPLAMAFAKKYKVIGFDINQHRIVELNNNLDKTGAFTANELAEIKHTTASGNGLYLTNKIDSHQEIDIFIVTVPTPVTTEHIPDLTALERASDTIASILKKDGIVVYESTVYPGCTEEICIPILEQKSDLVFNDDFYVGYSPERINPGDTQHPIEAVCKIVAGSNETVAYYLNEIYQSILTVPTYLAPSIKVAEAAKVIENTQRDINISFMNELSLIFDRLNIDTQEVLKAARTKWNFLPFEPGLVGGHCIGVDPYYLAYKAAAVGYNPQVILSGRRVNNEMAAFIASKTIKLLLAKDVVIKASNILVLGLAFKENIPDTRNSRVVDLYKELTAYGANVDVYDPIVDKAQVKLEYGIDLLNEIPTVPHYNAIILAVKHQVFSSLPLAEWINEDTIVFDTKSFLPAELVTCRL